MSLAPVQFICASLVQAGIVLTPAYLYATVKRSKPVAVAATLTLVLYLIQAVVLSAPNFGFLSTLQFNWAQKLSMLALTFLAAAVLKYKKSECGFAGPNSGKAFVLAILLGLICSLPAIIDDYMHHDFAPFTTEYFLFELTIPGLEEEPLYRGLLLCIWDKAIGRPYKIMGVQMGWGALISMALFCLGHGYSFDKNFHLVFAPSVVFWFDLISFSLAMTWLRYKYDSIWPPVIAHNLGNTGEVLAGLLISR